MDTGEGAISSSSARAGQIVLKCTGFVKQELEVITAQARRFDRTTGQDACWTLPLSPSSSASANLCHVCLVMIHKFVTIKFSLRR